MGKLIYHPACGHKHKSESQCRKCEERMKRKKKANGARRIWNPSKNRAEDV